MQGVGQTGVQVLQPSQAPRQALQREVSGQPRGVHYQQRQGEYTLVKAVAYSILDGHHPNRELLSTLSAAATCVHSQLTKRIGRSTQANDTHSICLLVVCSSSHGSCCEQGHLADSTVQDATAILAAAA
jgi:hypothetical protein